VKKVGIVYLVGAGPGDPGLLTLRGKELLEKAEVVVYDFLANPRLLELASPRAETIYVGKQSGKHSSKQEDITKLLVRLGRQGKRVVRLKGGDPFVFGRGGEEALALAYANIPFEVVPGITSGIAALAYAGIPLTHRGLAVSALFATGREREGKDHSSLDYGALARTGGTLVFFMGVENAPRLCDGLLKAGLAPDTPAAAIQWGTHPRQRTVVSRLDRFPLDLKKARLQAPALVVIGKVVEVRKHLNWFESKPLFGRRILVTRSREQASGLASRLEELGAEVFQANAIRIRPISPNPLLQKSFLDLPETDWLVFSSANGVQAYFEGLFQSGRDARVLNQVKVAAIGPATGQALADRGIKADLQAADSQAAGLAQALLEKGSLKGRHVILARAKKGRNFLPAQLRKAGAFVLDLPLYETLPAEGGDKETWLPLLESGQMDAVTFTSTSTVENFIRLFSAGHLRKVRPLVRAASIGPITAQTVRKAGFKLVAQSKQASVEGLAEALKKYMRKKG
jgi:uroporphyrinogen III methyltransferase/synthase